MTSRPLLIAHRGNSAHVPENTLAAFESAVAAGADWIELDLRITADDVVVVFHDATLWRLARRRKHVEKMQARELGEFQVVPRRLAHHGPRPIPLLREVLAGVGHQVPLYLEMKSAGRGRRDPIARRLLDACLREVPPRSPHALASFDAGLVRGALEAGRKAILILDDARALRRLTVAERRDLFAVSARWNCLSPEFVAEVRDLGSLLWTWTVDGDRRLGQVSQVGVDAICSNDVPAARRFLDRP